MPVCVCASAVVAAEYSMCCAVLCRAVSCMLLENCAA